MHIPGWSFISSVLTVKAVASHAPFAAADALAAPTFLSYAERQSYAGSGSGSGSHTAPLRYQRVMEPMADAGGAPYLRRDQASFPAHKIDIGSVDAASSIRIRRRAATVPTPTTVAAQQSNSASLFVRAYANAFHLTLGDARMRLKADDLSLYQSWETLSSLAQIDAPPAASVLASSAAGRAHAAALFAAYLQSAPETDDQAAINIAQSYLRRLAPTALDQPARAALYQAVLRRGLQWINVNKVGVKKLSAIHILQTVCRHRQVTLDKRSALTERLQHERDVIIDEAALIAAHAGPARADIPIAQMRAQFATALIDEWQDAALAQLLLPSSVLPPEHAQFWYDGSVMHNARGKDLEQIVSILYAATPQPEDRSMQLLIAQANRSRYLLAQPEGLVEASQRQRLTEEMHADSAALARYAWRPNSIAIGGVWLTRDELYAIVEKGMRDLALDTNYASGTPLHAIATIVHRLGPLHDIEFDGFNNPSALMDAYNQLEQAWQYSPHYPIKPSLCAAHFLAQTSDVLLLDQASVYSANQQIAQQVSAAVLPALQQADAQLASQSDYWHSTITLFSEGKNPNNAGRKREFGAGLPPFIGGITSALPIEKRAIYNSLETRLKALKNAPETMAYRDAEDLASQLDSYLKQRLLAQAPLPSYKQDLLIEHILRQKLFMSDDDLRHKSLDGRFYPGVMRSPPTWVGKEMRPIAIFKKRLISLDSTMHFKGHRIDAIKTLQAAQQEVFSALRDDPIVIAKAKEILRQHANVNTVSVVDELRSVLARSIVGLPSESSALDAALGLFDTLFQSQMLSAIVDALGSGEPRKIMALLPFVVPLYDIEEGIRLGDRQRAFDGAVHFGEDAIFTMLGMGAERVLGRQLARDAEAMLLARSRMSAGERAGVDMAHDMAQRFPQISPSQLAQRRVEIDEDAFNVWRAAPTDGAAQTLPKMREAQRMPDNRVHQTLYMNDEQRIVLVQPSASGFVETNVRGQPLLDAALIFGNTKTGRGYRLGRRVGLPGGAAGIAKLDLLKRNTVSSVKNFWESVIGLRNIRVKRTDVKQMINTLFKYPDGQTYTAFEQFWVKVYARSDTAVVILNMAYDRMISCGRYCDLEFNADRARVSGDQISFFSDSDLLGQHYIAFDGVTIFQRERMWVHEVVHWTTKLGDALDSEMYESRGATPYVTDRILSEVGFYPPLAPRIAYKMPPDFEFDESGHRAWSSRLCQLNDWVIGENNVLDKQLDVGRDYPSTLVVMGQKITERVTVRQGVALSTHIKSLGKLSIGNVDYLFQMVKASFIADVNSNGATMLRRLMHDSATFRVLAAAWSRKAQYGQIEIKLGNFDAKRRISVVGEQLAHHISAGGKTLWLNSVALYYFSDFDITLLSEIRRYSGAMIDLFLRDLIPHEHRLRLPDLSVERGLDVLLENEVLHQIGVNEARRITARLTKNPDAYLRYQTTTTRTAISEDGYLHQTCRTAASSADDDILGLLH